MDHIVSITSTGQMTIPKELRKAFGVRGPTKAVIRKEGKWLLVAPKRDFDSLEGSLYSGIKLSDRQLRKARDSFSKKWARRM